MQTFKQMHLHTRTSRIVLVRACSCVSPHRWDSGTIRSRNNGGQGLETNDHSEHSCSYLCGVCGECRKCVGEQLIGAGPNVCNTLCIVMCHQSCCYMKTLPPHCGLMIQCRNIKTLEKYQPTCSFQFEKRLKICLGTTLVLHVTNTGGV